MVSSMVPVLTLTRPEAAVAPECLTQRAVGNDGLTDAEREEFAWRYQTTGAGRAPGADELRFVGEWLNRRRGGSRLA